MDELLIDYLFDQLPPEGRRRVEAMLQARPEARERLARLRAALAPLEDEAEPEPPAGLLGATLARVAECGELPRAPRPRHHVGGAVRRWGRPVDWLVAAALAVLVGGVCVPLLARARAEQQRLACSNNLRKFWLAMQVYADRGQGEFPRVEAQGPRSVAGVFVPLLADNGLLPEASVGCPAKGITPPPRVSVAQLERMHRESPAEYEATARQLAGDYAYTLGYHDGGALRGLSRSSGDGQPLMADCAHPTYLGSANHGGRGQNVLFVGGHVRWCAHPAVGMDGDHIYVNQELRVSAGLNRVDTVLGSGAATPYQAE